MLGWSRGVCFAGVEVYLQRSRGVFLEEQSNMSRRVEEYFQKRRGVCLEEQRSMSREVEQYVQKRMSRGVCLEEQSSMSRGVEQYVQRRKGVCLEEYVLVAYRLRQKEDLSQQLPASQFGRALRSHDYPTGEQQRNHRS